MTAATTPQMPKVTSQPPKDSPHRGAPDPSATEAGRSETSAAPEAMPLAAASMRQPRVWRQEDSSMSLRKRASRELAPREVSACGVSTGETGRGRSASTPASGLRAAGGSSFDPAPARVGPSGAATGP